MVNRPLSVNALVQVRTALLSMSDLLSSLETELRIPPDISTNLREHVPKIESYLPPPDDAPLPAGPMLPVVVDSAVSTQSQMSGGTTTVDPFSIQLPAEHQNQLQNDLLANWPSDLGGLLDWLGTGEGTDTNIWWHDAGS